MAASAPWSAGRRGLYFLACLVALPLIGWGIATLLGATGGAAAGTIVTLPGVLLLGYGIWHARRIMRTIRMRLAGARAIPDDPVAEHAEGAFRLAGRLIGTMMLVLLVLADGIVLAVLAAVAAVGTGLFLGRAAREGRLPAPDFE